MIGESIASKKKFAWAMHFMHPSVVLKQKKNPSPYTVNIRVYGSYNRNENIFEFYALYTI